jgi:hypothetical protein
MTPIEIAKVNFQQAKGRMEHAVATTPEDRLGWSPSPSSRSPLHQFAHAAKAVKMILGQLQGTPFAILDTAEADKSFRAWESTVQSRADAQAVWDANCAEYTAWLDSLTPADLETVIQLPFGLGHACLAEALTFVPMHTNHHSAQIEYIQTIYGDQDWHMN